MTPIQYMLEDYLSVLRKRKEQAEEEKLEKDWEA
jgi:hypothetical protein